MANPVNEVLNFDNLFLSRWLRVCDEHAKYLIAHDALVAYVRASTVGSDNVKRMAEAYQALPDWVREEIEAQ